MKYPMDAHIVSYELYTHQNVLTYISQHRFFNNEWGLCKKFNIQLYSVFNNTHFILWKDKLDHLHSK